MPRGKRIQIACPAPVTSKRGNRITANRWAKVFEDLGYTVVDDDAKADVLVALNAVKTKAAVDFFRRDNPKGTIVVALTGTDIYGPPDNVVITKQVCETADKIVCLQDHMKSILSPTHQAKATVIVQAATAPNPKPEPEKNTFQICMLAHIREEKDPLVACHASKVVPRPTTLRLVHIGSSLDDKLAHKVKIAKKIYTKFQWLGEKSHEQSLQLLCKSQVLVSPSRAEGGPSCISEALACGVPILASNIPAHAAILGADYPGLFPVGDTLTLGRLYNRCEKDPGFYRTLQAACQARAYLVEPAREAALWDDVLKTAE